MFASVASRFAERFIPSSEQRSDALVAIILSTTIIVVTTTPLPTGSQAPAAQTIGCSPTGAERQPEGANELCLAAQQIKFAQSVERGTAEWRVHLQESARHFQTAAARADGSLKRQALDGLVRLYGPVNLNEPDSLESVLQQLIALAPDDVALLYQLAGAQEANGKIESAESTLLSVRHMRSEEAEPNKKLAQFYARRVSALQQQDPNSQIRRSTKPGEADEKGIYQVGRDIPPPTRIKKAPVIYPEDALAAGIEGAVSVDLVIDQMGRVVDAQVRRSVPLLDDAALQAVRSWRYNPAIVNGHAVPVRMTVLVPFQRPR
jgi:TonB family protein